VIRCSSSGGSLTHLSVTPDLEQLQQLAEGAAAGKSKLTVDRWRAALTELARHLQQPMSLPDTERFEAVLKAYLRRILRSALSGDDARFLALWQRDLGFVLKYKSYGVKCATALGYSVFLQNPGEGFSFQRHLIRKTEIFHIIEPLQRALVFLCTSQQWEALYETGRFCRWLDGAHDDALERLAVRPNAGDVYHVSSLGQVHSVLGCILEEFATVSTDMVDRLHDQNAGRHDPLVPRASVMARLRSLSAHPPSVMQFSGPSSAAIVRFGNAQVYELAKGPFDAIRLHIEQGSVELPVDPLRARILFTVAGQAACEIRGSGDAPGVAPPAIDVRGGDILMIPPGAVTTIQVVSRAACSIQGIEPEVALA
jgi:hypothetical protein